MKKNEKVLIKVSPKNIFKAGIGLMNTARVDFRQVYMF